jgi:hypothetical protein
MSSLLLERPPQLRDAPHDSGDGRERTPVLLVVRPSSSGMLRHVQGLIKYLPEFGYAPTLTGPDFIRDRAGIVADSRAVRILRDYAEEFPFVHCHGVRAGWVCAWAFRDQYPWLWTVHHLLLSKKRAGARPVALDCEVPARDYRRLGAGQGRAYARRRARNAHRGRAWRHRLGAVRETAPPRGDARAVFRAPSTAQSCCAWVGSCAIRASMWRFRQWSAFGSAYLTPTCGWQATVPTTRAW